MSEASVAGAYRRARPDEVPALVALVESAYRGEPAESAWTTEAHLIGGQRVDRDMLGAAMADPRTAVLVRVDPTGELVACCELRQIDGAVASFGRRLRRRIVDAQTAVAIVELHQHIAPVLAEPHVSGGCELLGEIAEAADAVGALRERRIELEERALEEPGLRRHLAVGQDLQAAADDGEGLGDWRGRRRAGREQ